MHVHTSAKVVPPELRAAAESWAAAADGAPGADLTRELYGRALSAQTQAFYWHAYLCPTCQEAPLSMHLAIAIARAQAESNRPLGMPAPWAGFATLDGPGGVTLVGGTLTDPPATRFTLVPDPETP
jgi:hypothetical protein